jgi:hypothetical protein
MRISRRVLITAVVAALPAVSTAPQAAASVTIGRLAPMPSISCAGSTLDLIEPTVTSGTTYVVPPIPPASNLVISSWSHNGAPGTPTLSATGPMTLKVFRKVADPATYQVVGHDTETLIPATLNTFQANIPVQPGDVIGEITATPASSACNFADTTGAYRASATNLADGQSAAFGAPTTGRSLNVTAVVSPSNSFTVSKGKPKRKKGTVALTIDAPNPGDLTLSGNGVKAAATTVAAPASGTLLVRAQGKKRKKLNKAGKVKVQASVTFTPTGGDPSTQSLTVKLLH